MNLAFLVGRFPPGPQGGAEHQAEGWARRLSDRHRVVVITRQEPPAPPGREARDGYEVIRLPLFPARGLRALVDAHRTGRALDALQPRPDLLVCFQSFISGWVGVRAQRRLGVPAIVWIRGEGEYRLGEAGLKGALNCRTWRAARGVLVQTSAGREALLRELERYAPWARAEVDSHLDVVPNGLDLPDPPLPAADVATGPVLAVGRLIRDKGMDVAIEAAAGQSRRLIIAGTGPERSRLEELARRRSASVEFAGFVGRPGLGALYAGAACVVLAARSGEGLPNVLLEAMSWGRPVIGTPVAGVRELIVDGVNGLLVPPGDPAALREALARVLSRPDLACRLGAGARRTAEGFAWERVRPRLEGVLERWAR